VNQKVEGFFMCCKHAGLNGKQGVMIPYPNIKDLMLDQEVVDAVKEGEFHVWAVKTVDEGIEILTGEKAGSKTKSGGYTKGSVYDLVDKKLLGLAEGLRDFAKPEEKKKKTTKRQAKKKSA